jgi:ParB-like chromosome segregation protein Spo0J
MISMPLAARARTTTERLRMYAQQQSAVGDMIARAKDIFVAGLQGGSWQPVAGLRDRIPADLARERYRATGICIDADKHYPDHVITSSGRELLAKEAAEQLVGSGLCERSGQGDSERLRLARPAPVQEQGVPQDDPLATDRPGSRQPEAVAETVELAEEPAADVNGPEMPSHGEMPFHPVAGLFPLLEGPEYEALKADILTHGLHVPVVTFQGQIIDGRNRYRACRDLGVDPKLHEWEGQGSLVAFVLGLNQHRRHLTESQRAMVAAKAKPLFEEEARQRMRAGRAPDHPPLRAEEGHQGEAAAQAAALLHVGRDSVYKAQRVVGHGAPELQQAVEAGQLSVSAAEVLTALPAEEQAEVLAAGKKARQQKVREIRQSKSGRPAGKRPGQKARAVGGSDGDPGVTKKTAASTGPEEMTLTLPCKPKALARALAEALVERLGCDTALRVLEWADAQIQRMRDRRPAEKRTGRAKKRTTTAGRAKARGADSPAAKGSERRHSERGAIR